MINLEWISAPVGTECLSCQSEDVERSWSLLGGTPDSGVVRCKACGHTESVVNYIERGHG